MQSYPQCSKTLLFDMHDMHKPSLTILKVREFQKGLTVNEFLEYLLSLKTKILFSGTEKGTLTCH
jgi:hypothetical protein